MNDSEKIACLEEEINYLRHLLDTHGIPYRKKATEKAAPSRPKGHYP